MVVNCVNQDEVVVEVEQEKDGEMQLCSLPFTICCWAAGAHPHSLSFRLGDSGVALSDRGWIRVGPTLQTVSYDNVFAAGDCSQIEGLGSEESPPKAGVYAVRAGPVLVENICKYLKEEELVDYDPQSDFLKIMNCGDGTAIGFRFGLPLVGKWVFDLKDDIDVMFMDLFRLENLPSLNDKTNDDGRDGSIHVAQYDDAIRQIDRIDALEAAKILARSDDGVDYQEAWITLREMVADEDYKREVLKCFKKLNR